MHNSFFRLLTVTLYASALLFSVSREIHAQSTVSAAEETVTTRKWLDVAYANQSAAQQLDIYLPAEGGGPFPVIVAIHGGAFKFGDKASGEIQAMLAGLKRGYAVVSVNYRLSGEATWPALIYDVKAAIRWIKAHGEEYHLDSNRLATWGGSAGGHLAALAGTSGGVAELEDKSMGCPDQSAKVQAVVDWFGPVNFLTMDEQYAASGMRGMKHNTPDSPESELLGKPISEVPELVRASNPETYITSDDPPFYIQHGTVDPLIPVAQSEHFADELRQVLGKENVVFEPLEGAGHGGPQFGDPANLSKVLDFLDKHLKNEQH